MEDEAGREGRGEERRGEVRLRSGACYSRGAEADLVASNGRGWGLSHDPDASVVTVQMVMCGELERALPLSPRRRESSYHQSYRDAAYASLSVLFVYQTV